MAHTLANGYTVVRIAGVHVVGGEPVRVFRDDDTKVIAVTDNGDPEALADNVAEAVDDSYVELARRARDLTRDSAIEILHALTFRKVPVIPCTESDPPAAKPSGL